MKSSFLPKYEPQYRAEILIIFGSYFGRNDDFINSFRNLLTFRMPFFVQIIKEFVRS